MNHRNTPKGFSLIELMITIAIIGILAAVVYPSYIDSVTRSNRSEAQRELVKIANLQEQFYVDFRRYTNDMTELGLTVNSEGAYITDQENYSIDGSINGSTFSLTAGALGFQKINDSTCIALFITETGAKTPIDCWE